MFGVIDHHPVTLEFTADVRTRRINCTGKTVILAVIQKKNTFFPVFITPAFSILICFSNCISMFRLDMDKKKLAGDTKPAVIITAVDLPFNGNEFPKAPAAFTTPIAFEPHGINTSCMREILPLNIRYFCPVIYQITKKI